MSAPPRLAVRAVIVRAGRVLLVNAWPGQISDLWCAPGGGVERGHSLPDTLIREVHEECGLTIRVADPCLINEFHDPDRGFHQVEVFFRAEIVAGELRHDWADPEGIVNRWRWASAADLATLRVKPDSLGTVAFDPAQPLRYDPLERIVR